MLGLLILLFTVLPLVELYFLFQAADIFGGGNTFAFVLLTGIVGAILAKSQGRSLLIEIQKKTAAGGLPTDEMVQGLMVLVGGVLLVTPGFVTDAIGFLLVLPLSRGLFLNLVKAALLRQIKKGHVKVYTQGSAQRYYYTSADEPRSEKSEVRDVTPPSLKD